VNPAYRAGLLRVADYFCLWPKTNMRWPAKAQRWNGHDCSSLAAKNHRVAEDQRAPLPSTPSFIDIANMPSTTALSLKAFLRSNHKRRMPNFIMSNADTNNVVDYILSLKQR
jgi:hypothetical protein